MASPRMIVTKRQSVFMAHVCSQCGFPMITVVNIEAEGQKSYDFSSSKAENIARETAEKAIRYEIRRIEACRITNRPLVEKEKGSSMISPGHFCSSTISGFASYCPRCLNLEPWKSSASKQKMDDLDRVNFPVVFEDIDEAQKWAVEKVDALINVISTKRKNPQEVENAITEAKEMKLNVLVWTHQVNSLHEHAEYKQLKNELEILKQKKDCLGLLNFKAKNDIGRRIQTLDQQIRTIKASIDKKIEPLAKQIIAAENTLLTTQAIAFGYKEEILTSKRGNAFSYSFSPNDIPCDILNEVERHMDRLFKRETSTHLRTRSNTTTPVKDEDIAFCRKCGFKLLPDSIFCTRCGSKID